MKKILSLILAIGILGSGFQVQANSGNVDIKDVQPETNRIISTIDKEIEKSSVLNENNYEVHSITKGELPDNVIPMQFDSVEEAIAYLEKTEDEGIYEESHMTSLPSSGARGLKKAANQIKSYDIKYERSFTSCYTLYATVDVDTSTKKITNTYNQRFELSGITLAIGIANVNVYTNYYENNTKIRVRADYQHIAYLLVESSLLEISRTNCYQQMWYTYDKGCHDGEFGYR